MLEFDFDERSIVELERKFMQLDDVVAQRIRGNAAAAAARTAAKEARKTAPVGNSGRLKKSIRVRRIPENGIRNGAARLSVGGRGAFYAGFVEHGTVKWAGKPFFRAAIENTEKEQFAAFVKTARRDFDRIVAQLATGTASRATARLAL